MFCQSTGGQDLQRLSILKQVLSPKRAKLRTNFLSPCLQNLRGSWFISLIFAVLTISLVGERARACTSPLQRECCNSRTLPSCVGTSPSHTCLLAIKLQERKLPMVLAELVLAWELTSRLGALRCFVFLYIQVVLQPKTTSTTTALLRGLQRWRVTTRNDRWRWGMKRNHEWRGVLTSCDEESI